MECTAENEGRKEKHSYGVAPDVIEFYYKCVDGKWIEMSESDYENDYEIEYYCTAEKPEKPKIGDTCSVKLGDSTRHYSTVRRFIRKRGIFRKTKNFITAMGASGWRQVLSHINIRIRVKRA